MSKKGFTLIEIMVVVIIVGILASLAVGNYSKLVEKGRSAEAKKVMSLLRHQEMAYYLEQNTFTTCLTYLGFVGSTSLASAAPAYYFYYGAVVNATNFNVTAIRCTGANGKQPSCPVSYMIKITDMGNVTYNDSSYQ